MENFFKQHKHTILISVASLALGILVGYKYGVDSCAATPSVGFNGWNNIGGGKRDGGITICTSIQSKWNELNAKLHSGLPLSLAAKESIISQMNALSAQAKTNRCPFILPLQTTGETF